MTDPGKRGAALGKARGAALQDLVDDGEDDHTDERVEAEVPGCQPLSERRVRGQRVPRKRDQQRGSGTADDEESGVFHPCNRVFDIARLTVRDEAGQGTSKTGTRAP